MSNTRNPSSAADDQAQQSSMSSSSSTSAMTSFLSSSAATESKEEKNATGREEKHDKTSIKNLYADVGSVLTSFLTASDHANLHEAVRFTTSRKIFAKGRLKKLMQAIVNGDFDEVQKTLTVSPRLTLGRLDEKDSITSLSGQKSNNVTPYRTALAVEDTQMADFIKNKMIEQKAGHLADQQFRAQFPAGWKAEEEKRWAPVFTQLTTLTHAIRDANAGDVISSGEPHYRSAVRENSAVAIALAEFRKQLSDRLNETITTGRHCNPNLLLEAFRIYEQHYADYFGNDWSDPRAMLFWQQVIGTIQRGLPVNVVQAFCDDLNNTEQKIRNNTPQARSLTIELLDTSRRSWEPTAFYPLAVSRLGFEWAAGGPAPCVALRFSHTLRNPMALRVFFEAYINQKQRTRRDICTSTTLESPQNRQRFAR